MPTAKVTSKGQITIPRHVRDRLGIKPGDQVDFIEHESGFSFKKQVPESPFKKYRGYLKQLAGRDSDELVEEMRGK